MARLRSKPVLIERVRLWWYPLALLPILALLYLGLAGILPALVVLFAVFALLFWLFSFGFALFGLLFRRRPPDLRQ